MLRIFKKMFLKRHTNGLVQERHNSIVNVYLTLTQRYVTWQHFSALTVIFSRIDVCG